MLTYLKKANQAISLRPAGPSGNIDMAKEEPWFISTDLDGNYTVTVPSDLESLADDPGATVAIAAICCLDANIHIGLPVADRNGVWCAPHPEVQQYYLGAAAALKTGSIPVYPAYSGWFGKGYNLIMRGRLSEYGIKPWLLKGSTEAFRKVFTHKQWADSIPAGWKHLEVLIRTASNAIKLDEVNARSWIVPLDNLKGSKIKKTLLSEKKGFLTQSDVDALHTRFHSSFEEYMSLTTGYSRLSLKECRDLEIRLPEVLRAIRLPELTAEDIIGHRAALIYQDGNKKRRSKQPLKVLIEKLDVEVYVNHFSPAKAMGIVPFTFNFDTIDDSMETKDVIAMINDHWNNYVSIHPEWDEILRNWWNTQVVHRLG